MITVKVHRFVDHRRENTQFKLFAVAAVRSAAGVKRALRNEHLYIQTRFSVLVFGGLQSAALCCRYKGVARGLVEMSESNISQIPC